MLLISSSSVVLEEVDFFRTGDALILPPPIAMTEDELLLSPGLVELGDPGEAMLEDPRERGEKTGFICSMLQDAG